LRHLFAEEAEGSAAIRLGAIERHVGVFEQRIRADAVRRGHRNPDAGADFDQMIVDLVALAQMLDNSPGETRGILVRFDVLLKHHKFVAAEPRHEILRAQHFAQPVGDRAQQPVAARMTQGIVDLLELIEVDKQQCRQLHGVMRNRQKALDLVAEVEPVGQRRQFVVTRQMSNSGFGVAPFGDVFKQHDGAAAGHRLKCP